MQVATLGKSGVSVGYYDTEEAAARAYDRAAIGLLGRNHSAITTNFPMQEYDKEPVPQLIGKSREEVHHRLVVFLDTAEHRSAGTEVAQCCVCGMRGAQEGFTMTRPVQV